MLSHVWCMQLQELLPPALVLRLLLTLLAMGVTLLEMLLVVQGLMNHAGRQMAHKVKFLQRCDLHDQAMSNPACRNSQTAC